MNAIELLMDGYRCDCGWVSPISEAPQINGEPFCGNPKCDAPYNLEPVFLCRKCRQEPEGAEGICPSCEQEQFRRDRATQVKPLLKEAS